MNLSSSDIGRAGEHRVVSELLLRGLRPLLAIVDDGIDVTIENGPSLQVKAATNPRWQGQRPAYSFSFQSTARVAGGLARRRQRMLADFAVCWCIPENQFYIVPRDVIGNRTVVWIPTRPARRSMFTQYLNAWEMLR